MSRFPPGRRLAEPRPPGRIDTAPAAVGRSEGPPLPLRPEATRGRCAARLTRGRAWPSRPTGGRLHKHRTGALSAARMAGPTQLPMPCCPHPVRRQLWCAGCTGRGTGTRTAHRRDRPTRGRHRTQPRRPLWMDNQALWAQVPKRRPLVRDEAGVGQLRSRPARRGPCQSSIFTYGAVGGRDVCRHNDSSTISSTWGG
jgi:hypothetical protein